MTRRLLVSYLSLTLVVLLVLELPLGVYVARSERRDLTARLERDAVTLAGYAEDALARGAGFSDEFRAVVRRYADEAGARVVVVDREGVGVLDTGAPEPGERSFATRPEVRTALGGSRATGTRHSDTLRRDLLYVAVPAASGGRVHGAVRLTFPTTAVEARIRRAWLVLAALGAVVLEAVGVVGRQLARTVSRPLLAVEHAAAAAGAGDLAARAPVGGPPEVQALARTFNAMATELDALVRSQEAFVADASHELRTPLAALRLRLENLERDVTPAGRADLEGALDEAARLAGLVDGLLALARADVPHLDPTRTVDLSAVARDRVEAWSALAEERDVRLVLDAGRPAPALASAERVEQVVDNLLSNAIEVSPAGGSIRIRTAAVNGQVELHVVDEGPGLDEVARVRAFDRFWRGDAPSGEGSGLGLAISRRLMRAAHGDVELLPAPDGGIDARVRLPTAPDGVS